VGGYIRMDKDLEDDPRVGDLGDFLADSVGIDKGLARDAVMGGLYRLWRHGDTHLGRHNRLKGASHGLARISEVTALPVSLLERFPTEWLRVHEDGSVELPDYAAKNALIDRDVRRANGRERTQRWREKKHRALLTGDTSHRVTTETSQRHQTVTTGTGTGTGTETGPSVTETGTGDVSGRRVGDAAVAVTEPHPDPQRIRPPANLQDRSPRFPLGSGPEAARPTPTPTKTEAQLQADAQALAAAGNSSWDIAKLLGGYGVTPQKVSAWLANAGTRGPL